MERKTRPEGLFLDDFQNGGRGEGPGDEVAMKGAVASWLVRLTPDGAVLVRALAGDFVLEQDALLSRSCSREVAIRHNKTTCFHIVKGRKKLKNNANIKHAIFS